LPVFTTRILAHRLLLPCGYCRVSALSPEPAKIYDEILSA